MKKLQHNYLLYGRQLIACDTLSAVEAQQIRQVEGEHVRCPTCKLPMRLELTDKGWAAVHVDDSKVAQHEIEDPIGRSAKRALVDLVKMMFPTAIVELDVVIDEVEQIADIIIVNSGGGKIAIEYQAADLSAQEVRERTESYEKEGIECLWILDARRMKIAKRGAAIKKVTLEKLETALLANNEPLLYLDIQHKQLIWVHAPKKAQHLAELGEPRLGQLECLVRSYRLTMLRIRDGAWWIDPRLEPKPIKPPQDIPAGLEQKLRAREQSSYV